MGGQMGGGPGGPGGQRDSFMQGFYPPEFVMKNQQDLALSEEQEVVIKEVMKEQMGEFSTLQWEQTEAQDALTALLKATIIEQGPVLDELDKLLTVEAKIKKLQVTGMIKVRNVLTPDQLDILKEKKQSMRPMGMGRMGGRGGMEPQMAPTTPAEATPEPAISEPAPVEAEAAPADASAPAQ
jgi:Spy/CpxP family protein refolding chaperone